MNPDIHRNSDNRRRCRSEWCTLDIRRLVFEFGSRRRRWTPPFTLSGVRSRGPFRPTDTQQTRTYLHGRRIYYIDSPFTLLITLWLTTSDGDSNRVRTYDYYTVMTDNKRPTMHRVELTITRVLRRGQEQFPLIPLATSPQMPPGGGAAFAPWPRHWDRLLPEGRFPFNRDIDVEKTETTRD